MTPIEWIAAILIVFAVVKILVLLVKPVAWMKFAKAIWSNAGVVKIVAFVLAGVVLYYLDASGITIVQIFAVTAFVALLAMVGLADEVEYFIKKYSVLVKTGKIWKKYWLYTIIWIALLIWGIKVLWI